MTDPIENFEKLSRLAQIAFDEQERIACQTDLEQIIEMVDAMNRVDTDGVEPLSHPLDAVQRLRVDQVTEQINPDKFQQLAPQARDGLYLVPRVLD